MAFNFKRAQEAPPQFCIFGKLPRRGDFVRVNATHPAATQLDQLLAQSLLGLESGPEAVERYRATPATSFVLRSRDQMWLSLGVMQPSRDESGRNYPLVAASLLPCDTPLPPLSVLMLANELFFSGLKEQLSSAIDNAVEMLACRQFLEEQSWFGSSSSADIELAQQLLERHMAMTPASRLGALLAQRGLPDLETVLLAFTFHHQLLRKFKGSLTAQTYLLPLPDSDGEDMLAAATWLSLYQAATTGQGGQAEQCLLMRRPEGRFLALLPGELNEQIVAQCWGGQLDARFVVDVAEPQAPWRNHQAYAEAAYILGRRLNDPSISVAQLSDVASSLSRSVA